MVKVQRQIAWATVVSCRASHVKIDATGLDKQLAHIETVKCRACIQSEMDWLVELCQLWLKGLEVGRRDVVFLHLELKRSNLYLADGILERRVVESGARRRESCSRQFHNEIFNLGAVVIYLELATEPAQLKPIFLVKG